ncbi:F0F1 ATP synthase subunit epsilon [Aureimonas phyllosphaerae]|uniref:ATP synthase epsilon chain n=1 Tax=Aureimonas phyllosphaerae TaxID=1166078 RepID=A0A7W6BS91_9HYPH|nr:F0F1 ATP synthase subunit epsilon [Aureimonas phyllosphaerae]MBB3934078.1 F-type H+-transporting ATPase subunit epsilon [Aureimonas phyllosphaerae]MBB3958706.1 F-type H+-transporting ATPase subunit epsilon [Aureimonas phyllosphaerae]SFF18243.1 ATP synthase F1 subcomplex epsilon subunit [Aureimonas phyllosphaerae]
MAESFKFELVSPERLLLSEQVSAVVAPGSEGYFTAMPGHAPFMTTLKPGVVQATLANGGERRIFVQGGFADINPEGFTLLAEHAMPVEEIDAAELDQQIRNTEEDVADATDATVRSRAERRLADLRNAKEALGL